MSTHEHTPTSDWLDGYRFALTNLGDEAVQSDRARYLAGAADTSAPAQDLTAERAAAPALAARYDDACRSVADLHAQLMRAQGQITAIRRTLQDVRSRLPREHHHPTEQKKVADLAPGEDALVSPSWMVVDRTEKRVGGIRIHGWTTLDPTATVTVRPAPGTLASAQWAADPDDEDE